MRLFSDIHPNSSDTSKILLNLLKADEHILHLNSYCSNACPVAPDIHHDVTLDGKLALHYQLTHGAGKGAADEHVKLCGDCVEQWPVEGGRFPYERRVVPPPPPYAASQWSVFWLWNACCSHRPKRSESHISVICRSVIHNLQRATLKSSCNCMDSIL